MRAERLFDGARQTLQAVGNEIHLTAERVRQIPEHALETLCAAGSTVLSQVVAEYADAEALDSEADRVGA
jgi:DNA-directed RNA polymerase sigma subunit (sigma70/sigma32)